ncbi:hypothetical protein [Niallia sp. FSL R7-0271]|uniref:hypothetical protein n=1 Tax=Niallia sp. FSL R7-0271 TaxID=2921678 RepID=UPI0030F670FC
MRRYRKLNKMPIFLLSMIIVLLTACVNNSENITNNEAPPTNEKDNANDSNSKKSNYTKNIIGIKYKGELELPVDGSTGYTSISLELKASPNVDSNTINLFEAGTAFEILREEGEWWLIRRGVITGWFPNKYCFINLPDVIPSIVYDNTNTYPSKFTSSEKAIPNITGIALYSGKTYNKRLKKDEFIMPVLYSMSKKIYKAQQNAMSEGKSLKFYEGFRPYSTQKAVVKGLSKLAKNDPSVMKGINDPPWGISWFIRDGVSNHQVGYGADISLVKVITKKEILIGEYKVNNITEFTEYEMPSQIHELSGKSAIFTTPVTSSNATAWKHATYTVSMNDAAKLLQKYATEAGLTPLASEWWHFNDLHARDQTADNRSNGDFILMEVYSSIPN